MSETEVTRKASTRRLDALISLVLEWGVGRAGRSEAQRSRTDHAAFSCRFVRSSLQRYRTRREEHSAGPGEASQEVLDWSQR